MALSSSAFCASPFAPSSASSSSSSRALQVCRLNQTQLLAFPFDSPPKRGSNLTLKSSPPPLRVLCKRGSGGSTAEKPAKSDPVYRNRLVNMMVNRVMKNGKKSLAYQIIYRALKRIQQKTGSNPLSVLREAMQGVTPDVAVKATRVGGSTHQVPIEVGSAQGKAIAIRWLLQASRKREGQDMVYKLSTEIIDAAKGSGSAIRKKEETHRMAEANRAFAHYR